MIGTHVCTLSTIFLTRRLCWSGGSRARERSGGTRGENHREQPLVPGLGSLARESWLGTTIARRAGRDHFLFSYSHGHRGRKLSSVDYLPVGGGFYVGDGFGSVIFCLPRTNTTMPSRVQRELSSLVQGTNIENDNAREEKASGGNNEDD